MAESKSKTKDALRNAPAHVANVAANLAQDLFYEQLNNIRPPKEHRVVPEVTVSVTYRFESTKGE